MCGHYCENEQIGRRNLLKFGAAEIVALGLDGVLRQTTQYVNTQE